MEGSIVRLKLSDFITFHSVTVEPSSHLNLITGPNGSGKSSIMCALCLGLAGKPKVVGRASNVNEYIRYNAEKATIEIELFNPQGRNYIVSRTICRDNKSSWSIGGFSCTQKEVEALTSRLNIQIDNLCQFLPQDRVQDFAKMNSLTLMENTEKCIGGLEMWENHMKLKKLGSSYMENEKLLTSKQEYLGSEEQIFSSLQDAMDKMKSKKALILKVERLKQKHALLIYDISTGDKKMSEDVLNGKIAVCKALIKQMKPIEANLNISKSTLKAAEDKLKNVGMVYTKHHTSSEADFELPETTNDQCKENINDYERYITKEKRRLEKLKDIRIQINYMESMINELNEKGLKEKDAELSIEEREEMKIIYSLQMEKQPQEMKIMTVERQMNLIDQEIAKANDLTALKLRHLKSKNLYEPVMWFRKNKDKLRGKAYEPMFTVINMKNIKMAKYLESIVSYRDLIAFVCECPEDANFLMEELRDKLHYKINVITSKPTLPMSSFTRQYEIQSLQKYGFYSFVSDTFTAPEAIMRYLFSNCWIHRIPIGDNTTFLKADEVPNDIRLFMTDDKKFSVKTSKYTQESISSAVQIKEASLLTISTNETGLKELNTRKSKLKEEYLGLRSTLEDLESQENKHNERVQIIKKLRSETKGTLSKINSTKSRIVTLKRSEEENTKKESDEEDQKRVLLEANKKCTCQLISALDKNIGHLKKLGDIIMMVKLTHNETVKCRYNVSAVENELRVMTKKQRDAEKEEKASREVFEEANSQATRHLKQFEELAKVKYKSKEYTNILKTFTGLPETMEEIEREMHITETKAECLGHSDTNVVKEYERRKTIILAIRKVIDKMTSDLNKSKEEIEQLKQTWLPFVNDLIKRIDVTFGGLLSRINYVGEVILVQGEGEYDFANYGFKIQVKFRQEGGLQELNQFRQSGGERAVAIAVYLMSLQELTSVPFRCVDEINQGMDEFHEAVVFKLLSDIVSKPGGAQYFLFTPKILRTLKFSDTLLYSCVFNGEVECTSLNFKKIIKKKQERKKTKKSM